MEHFAQILLLLAVALTVVFTFQRMHIPTSLGYLLVGIILGPYTIGPIVYVPEFDVLAQFGVVFLLFTIGLNYSLPQLQSMRQQFLWLGTGQVVLTTSIVTLIVWLLGVPATAAFVIGAVFAQSSTTIIASVLGERNEENAHHGRLGLAMSVFQDVTAVPFLVVIPVLGTAVSTEVLAGSLGWAFAKAVAAAILVYLSGRWFLGPLFGMVAQRRSGELFTLAVLLVALLAAWTTDSLGLSLAFGGFLAGMMLGETEFRHQIESSIRPFRDVLLGMFFVGIGMRFDLSAIPPIWHWCLLGALLILSSKILIVAAMVRRAESDAEVAWRTGLLLSVGGEFGLALVAIATDVSVLGMGLDQIAITSVLLSMIAGAVLIRFNGSIAGFLTGGMRHGLDATSVELQEAHEEPRVIIGGYGRVGHTVAVLLQSSGVPFIAVDIDMARVAQGRADGHTVWYGDVSDPGLLSAIHAERASLIVMTLNDSARTLQTITHLRGICPQVPIIARARDLDTSHRLLQAGAVNAYPEAIEASLKLGATALQLLQVPTDDVDQLVQDMRNWGYRPVMDGEEDGPSET